MSCEHCSQYVVNTLEELNGVQSCEVNLNEGIAKVEFDANLTDKDTIAQAIVDTHYDFVSFV